MKTKVLVQILLVAFLASASMVQAQENIERSIKKEMRRVKQEMRKAKKDIKNSMKDVDWEVEVDNYEGLAHDLELELDELECLHEISPLEHIRFVMPPDNIDIPDFDFEVPEIDFDIPEIDIDIPKVYKLRNYFPDQGNLLELSKDLEDVNISKDFFFDVNSNNTILDLRVDGSLEDGELIISLKQPDGEVYQKFHISPLANVGWNQQINLMEEEKYKGKWTISLSGSAATGSYNIRIKAK